MGNNAMFTMELLSITGTVGVLLLWLLVPVVPAVLIYRLVPDNKVAVTGPFKGLTLNMSGAFAAYFVLCVAASFSWVDRAFVELGDLKRLAWTVKGSFQMVDKDGKVIHPGDDFVSRICVRTQPNTTDFRDTDEAGTFEFSVPERERKLPTLFVETTYNTRIQLKLDQVDPTQKTATIKMLRIPGLNRNTSEMIQAQTQPAQK
jgi:hypothetical protein